MTTQNKVRLKRARHDKHGDFFVRKNSVTTRFLLMKISCLPALGGLYKAAAPRSGGFLFFYWAGVAVGETVDVGVPAGGAMVSAFFAPTKQTACHGT